MPHYKQVEVEVLGERGLPLREHGESKNARMNMTSCFIQSQTDERFCIRITPDKELLRNDEQDVEYSEDEEGDEDEDEADDEDIDTDRPTKQRRPKPWHFLATLKLDGRPEIERRVFVFLDRSEGLDSVVVLRGAVVRDSHGVWREYEWVFKDVGIDVAFDNLQLGGIDQGTVSAQPEDDLTDAYSALGSPKPDENEEKGKAGQIQVRIDRVTVGRTVQGVYGSLKYSKELSKLDGSLIGDSEHTVGRSEGIQKAGPSSTTFYEHLDDEEEPYALFRFNYCEEKKLRKLGFLDAVAAHHKSNKRNEALKMAALVQKKPKPAIDYKFRNMKVEDQDEAHDGDDEDSVNGGGVEDEDDGEGPSEDHPLGDLGAKLGALNMDRTRKRDDEGGSDEGEKKVRSE